MEKNIAELYRLYQKNSDTLILETYSDLLKKSEDKNIGNDEKSDIINRLTAIQEVIQERKLDIKQLKLQAESEQKDKSNAAFNNYLKDGFKSLIIGIGFFGISLALMSKFQGNTLLYIGMIIGGFKFIQGAIELAVGLYVRVSHARKF